MARTLYGERGESRDANQDQVKFKINDQEVIVLKEALPGSPTEEEYLLKQLKFAKIAKPILIGIGIVLLLLIALFGYRKIKARRGNGRRR